MRVVKREIFTGAEVVLLIFLATMVGLGPQTAMAADTVSVFPPLSDEILINPGKGWLIYGDGSNLDSLPSGAVAKAAAGYYRFEWAQIEPAEDDYRWEIIDNAIQRFAARGLRFSFGIMPANSCTTHSQVTPEWVFKAGAAYTTYISDCIDGSITLKAPVWNDPVFLEKLWDLIQNLKARYDGRIDIAFIDNRNCGMWGEWHSLGCSELSEGDKAALVDMFAGWTTPIIVPTNGDGLQYQVTYGNDLYRHGCRRDSSEYDQNGCAGVYDYATAVSEWSTSYASLKACQTWYGGGCWDDNLIPAYMSWSRYSYDNMGQWGNDCAQFYNEQTHLVDEWANKMGYWFRLLEATYSQNLGNGAQASLFFKVRNDGVAPIYVNRQNWGQTYVKIALLNARNAVLATTTLKDINPYNWKPFDKTNAIYSETVQFYFPYETTGVRLAIGLFTKESLTNPDIRLGNQGRLSSGWYLLTLPDLTGLWNYLTQTCKNTSRGTRCTLKGKFTIQNIGNMDASSSTVKFYLSNDNTSKEGDTFLKRMSTWKIKEGRIKAINLNINLPIGQTASGKHLIAIIDADNAVLELNETNNYAVYGPIQ